METGRNTLAVDDFGIHIVSENEGSLRGKETREDLNINEEETTRNESRNVMEIISNDIIIDDMMNTGTNITSSYIMQDKDIPNTVILGGITTKPSEMQTGETLHDHVVHTKNTTFGNSSQNKTAEDIIQLGDALIDEDNNTTNVIKGSNTFHDSVIQVGDTTEIDITWYNSCYWAPS